MATFNNHITHPEHPLVLVTTNSSVMCWGCNSARVGEGQMYNCSSCGFYLHTRCAVCPHTKKFKRLHSHHEMTLGYDKPSGGTPPPSSWECGICRKPIPGSGLFYMCAPCNFNVHLLCAARSPATTAAASAGKGAVAALSLSLITLKGLDLLCEATTGITGMFDSTSDCVGDDSGLESGVDTAGNDPDMDTDAPFEFSDKEDEDGWQWKWDLL